MRNNKLLTKILCVSLVMILVGFIICTASFISGGRPNYLYQQRSGIFSFFSWDPNPRSNNENTSFTNKAEIKTINIDANQTEIKIVSGEKFNIQLNNVPASYAKVTEANGIYSMTVNDRRFNFTDNHAQLIISVPPTIDELNIKNDIGSVEASNLKLKNLNIDVNVGDIELQNITFNQGDFKLDLGSFEMYGDFTKMCNVKNSAGDVDIKLMRSNLDYNYNLSVDLGELSINNENHGDINAKYNQNNGKEASLDATLNLGDLDIEFTQGGYNNDNHDNDYDNDYDRDDDHDNEYDD